MTVYHGFNITEDLEGSWHVTCQHAGMQAPLEHAMFRSEVEAKAWVDDWRRPPTMAQRMLSAERSERMERGE